MLKLHLPQFLQEVLFEIMIIFSIFFNDDIVLKCFFGLFEVIPDDSQLHQYEITLLETTVANAPTDEEESFFSLQALRPVLLFSLVAQELEVACRLAVRMQKQRATRTNRKNKETAQSR